MYILFAYKKMSKLITETVAACQRGGEREEEGEGEGEMSHYLEAVRVQEVENYDHGSSPYWHRSGGSRGRLCRHF
jgi:hypothetical protein